MRLLPATSARQPAGVSLPTVVNHVWLGAAWQVSTAFGLNAAVYHANTKNGNGNATMYTLAGQYNLSLTLSGSVESQSQMDLATKAAQGVDGVTSEHNNLSCADLIELIEWSGANRCSMTQVLSGTSSYATIGIQKGDEALV
ncbi:hypothetical protein LJR034_008943 [Caballeronia sp. LjRoot34]|uniref:BON domain-containing protein n=1 Tax=Caballeronia sp. LjRoot34 TaxID=3342325 RepID=UPI003ECC6F54